jgi:hypothetical protein
MRGRAPDGFPRPSRDAESRETVMTKIAVWRGKPTFISVRKRTCCLAFLTLHGMKQTHRNIPQYTDNHARCERLAIFAVKETFVRWDKFRQA